MAALGKPWGMLLAAFCTEVMTGASAAAIPVIDEASKTMRMSIGPRINANEHNSIRVHNPHSQPLTVNLGLPQKANAEVQGAPLAPINVQKRRTADDVIHHVRILMI